MLVLALTADLSGYVQVFILIFNLDFFPQQQLFAQHSIFQLSSTYQLMELHS
jgi:hypothetical protein